MSGEWWWWWWGGGGGTGAKKNAKIECRQEMDRQMKSVRFLVPEAGANDGKDRYFVDG